MSILADLRTYARFAWGLRGFLSHSITLEEARAIVQRRLAERENNFLRLVEKGIFGYPRSPYLPLLKQAGCELGDIQNMVRARGLEPTLYVLREAGVHVTFEEFKGRQPIVRGGQVIRVQAHDFDNPYLSHYYQAESGATTGAGTRVSIDLDHMAAQAPLLMLSYAAHGVLGVPTAMWRSPLPANSGFSNVLRHARFGQPPPHWFSPITVEDWRLPLKWRLATQYIITAGRVFGLAIPSPQPVRLDQATVVARWMAEVLKARGACLMRAHVSTSVRVCVAARGEGIDLRGATFMGAGEPPTPAKVREITRTGARYVPNYNLSEIGFVGTGCVCPADQNDVHLFRDAVALIQYPRRVPGTDVRVDAFHFTSLLPTAPKLMLNVESDDYGVIEERRCGCVLEHLGYPQHLRHIRSFRKLTGEGMTLIGSDMVRILEEVLPARFGGSPQDYQLMEEEDEQGLTRLILLVNPSVEIADEDQVVNTVLEALRRSDTAANLARTIWSQAKTLQVRRSKPVWTRRGILMPLHLGRRFRGSGQASTDQRL